MAESGATGNGSFIENRGQWDSRAQFLSQMPGVNMWVTSDGVLLDFHKFTRTNKVDPSPKLDRPEGVLQGQVVKISFAGGNRRNAAGASQEKAPYNYIRKTGTIKNVRRFDEVWSQNIYSGISARYYLDHGSPRYDLVVSPGADPSQIGMNMEGADDLIVLPDGNLGIQTSLGTIEERGLTVYQGQGTGRKQIPATMSLEGHTLHLHVGAYDPTQSLIIDPVVYSSYIGGSSYGTTDRALAMTGSVGLGNGYAQYIGGLAVSLDFPTTTGAYQTTMQTGAQGWLAQINSQTGQLNWCTFVQGTSLDNSGFVEITCLWADSNNNAIVGGYTYEEDFPTTTGAFQTTNSLTDGFQGFVAKISSDGTTLMDSTFLGGTTSDTFVLGLGMQSTGVILVTGKTKAKDFPTVTGAVQTTNGSANGGQGGMAFATGINPDFSSLYCSTLLGGSATNVGYGISAGHYDEIAVAGQTTSSDFPLYGTGYETSYISNGGTGFIDNLRWDASEIYGGTYFGGSGAETIYAVYSDPGLNIWIAGSTTSGDLPVTQGCYQVALNGSQNGFIAELDQGLDSLEGCTYFGGSGSDTIYGLTSPSYGNPWVCGSTTSSDFPTTTGCYQSGIENGSSAFVAAFSGTNSLTYSTCFGGGTTAYAIAPDNNGNSAIAGEAYFVPTTPGAFQSTSNAPNGSNAFYADVSQASESISVTSPSSLTGGQSSSGAVTLSSPANSGGVMVNLQSSSGLLNVQADTFIDTSLVTGGFKLSTSPVSAPTTVTITATSGAYRATTNVNLMPYHVKSAVIAPTTVIGGAEAVCTVTLGGPAGTVSETLTLTASVPAALSVPASMTIAAGKTTGSFVVKSSPVNASTAVTVKVANLSGGFASAVITVTPPEATFVSCNPSAVIGGTGSTGTVSLNGYAGPAGATVTLVSSVPAAAQVPTSIKVPAGKSSITFPITTSPVNADQPVKITATYNSTTASGSVTVDTALLSSVSVSPSPETGGLTATGTVTMGSAVGSSGMTITLSSANHTLATVPASVKVAADKTTATFSLASYQVLTNSSVVISASLGSTTKTATLNLIPVALSSFGVTPQAVTGGTTVTGTITMTAPIGISPVFVTVTSSNGAVAKPEFSSVDVGTPGSATAQVPINTFAVNASTSATLTASYGSVSKMQSITVNPAAFSAISLSPTSVVGGKPSTGTVTLTGPAGSSTVIVNLSSNNAAVKVPASVTVPAGSSSKTFPITTSAVTKNTAVTITGKWNTLTKSTTITLTP